MATAQRAEERRSRLLTTALQLFATQGYARTTIEQLCADARVTTRHFYELFESRESLLAALYQQIANGLQEALSAALARPAIDLEQKITATVRSMLAHYLGDSRVARIGVLEVVGVSAELERRRRAVIHQLARLLEAYLDHLMAAVQRPARRHHLTAVAMVGGVNELLAEWLTVDDPPHLDELGDEVAALFLTLLRGLAPAPQKTHAGDLPS